jgi:hypothetical protein
VPEHTRQRLCLGSCSNYCIVCAVAGCFETAMARDIMPGSESISRRWRAAGVGAESGRARVYVRVAWVAWVACVLLCACLLPVFWLTTFSSLVQSREK